MTAVILNHKTVKETLECVQAVRDQEYPCEISVVDNASDDGSEGRLRAELSDCPVHQRGRNLGYGDGNNLGIRAALSAGTDYIWIVSPDVRAAPDCLGHMVRLMESQPEIGICGPVLSVGGRTVSRWTLVEALGYQVWTSHARRAPLPSPPDQLKTGFVEGGSMLIRSEVARTLGGFRTDLFMYYEDCEFSLRAKDAGWRLAICARAQASTRGNDGHRNRRYYYMTRNSIAMARLRGSYVARAVVRNVLLYPLYVVLKGQKPGTGLKAVWDGLHMPLAKEADWNQA